MGDGGHLTALAKIWLLKDVEEHEGNSRPHEKAYKKRKEATQKKKKKKKAFTQRRRKQRRKKAGGRRKDGGMIADRHRRHLSRDSGRKRQFACGRGG